MWKLKITGFKKDHRKIQAIKEICYFNKKGLKEAKGKTDYFPQIIAITTDLEHLKELSKALKETGAICYIRKCSELERFKTKYYRLKELINARYGKTDRENF